MPVSSGKKALSICLERTTLSKQIDSAAMDPEEVVRILAEIGMTVSIDELPSAEEMQEHNWKRTEVKAPDNQRLSPVFLANEKRSIPDMWFRQEWLCEFVDTVDSVFRYDDIMAMMSDEVEPLFGDKQPFPFISEEIKPLFISEEIKPLFGDNSR